MTRTTFSLPGVIDTPIKIGWNDLILPKRTVKSLREYLLWVTHRDQVELKWKGRFTGGPIALFSGPSGTGKTLASNALAHKLNMHLATIDLGSLASTYIGETEKNLDAVLAAALNEPTLLVFDEADSLFGKRHDVQDSHDRYANAGLNYLLSRLERHRGPCILTTNSGDQIDPAFAKRCHFVVDFPLPNETQRNRLWRQFLPAGAPLGRSVDTARLAVEWVLTGGQIRNAALHAAFLAAGDSSSITLKHITKAVSAELAKAGQ
jgi:SpoVK/Ycf46/Vps4 family AAA+-type ATPase